MVDAGDQSLASASTINKMIKAQIQEAISVALDEESKTRAPMPSKSQPRQQQQQQPSCPIPQQQQPTLIIEQFLHNEHNKEQHENDPKNHRDC